MHSVNTRNKHLLHRPIINLLHYHKSTYYLDIKIVNKVPSNLKNLLSMKTEFGVALKRYLICTRFILWMSFYSLKLIHPLKGPCNGLD
jgi:hypothetical protein